MMRRWLVRAPIDPAAELARLNLPPLVERILIARGLRDSGTIQRFCEPRLADLHDPSLLPGVDAAAERLVAAARSERSIAIYGDYDVDGITATAILYHIIRAAAPGARIRAYVPHRIDEGYGLGSAALRQLADEGVDLVVSVDCGATAVEPAATARKIGLELIITDHHHLPGPGEPRPDALLVHPRAPGSAYPFPELCGAGVAFKLAWRFATCWCRSERVSKHLQQMLLDLLPFVALGTIADVVPLVGENRILTSFGLRLIKATPFVGLRALIEAAGLMDDSIDSEKVGFVLAPRLNACGRMGHAGAAVHLLTTAAEPEAARIAHRLTQLNDERRRIERGIVEQAAEMAAAAGMTGSQRRVIVLADPSWHPGVLGIVCSRLVERFGRPTVLLRADADQCKGSARSIEGYSIHDGLAAGAEHLIAFGGHDAAAGLTLAPDHLEAFTDALTAHANGHIAVDDLTPMLRIDCDASLAELERNVVKRIASLAPFGRENRRPTVRISEVVITEPPRPIGGQGRHLMLRLAQVRAGERRSIRGVWWGGGEVASKLAAGMCLDVAVEPKINAFRGRESVEAEIRDVRVTDPARSVIGPLRG